jgi:HK97 family phage major capsid protein
VKLKEQLLALQKAMQSIVDLAKSEDRALTAEEAVDVEAKGSEAMELKSRIESIQKSDDTLRSLVEFGAAGSAAEKGDDDLSSAALGERFMKSAPYQTFAKAHASGVGAGSPINIDRVRIGSMKDFFVNRKALVSGDAHAPAVRMPTIDQVSRDQLSLLDLVSRGTTGGNFEYVQITSVTRNAAIVPEATSGTDAAALKPVSEIGTALADAKVYTYADGYDVTNQLLSDAPAFASYLDGELRYSLDAVVEEKLLNGSGVSGEPVGILNTTGIQEADFTGANTIDLVKGVRKGITKVSRLQGGRVDAILLNPEDLEAIDLLQDANNRFYGQGPFGSGPQTLWGRPVVLSERIDAGSFLLGDFKQVALLDREGLSVLAFNQHKDYAQRNMTYVRAELRAAQVVWKPSRLVFGSRTV